MLQYTGFAIVPGGRLYSFSVPGHEAPARCFTVVIENAAFRPGLLKYQEGPEICYGKLLAALSTEEDASPLSPQQRVSEPEVVAYKASGRTKVRKWTEEQRLEAKQRFKASRAERAAR